MKKDEAYRAAGACVCAGCPKDCVCKGGLHRTMRFYCRGEGECKTEVCENDQNN